MSSEVNYDELLNKGDEIIQKLIDTGGRSWCLSIPARPDEDPDLVLSKIISEARKGSQAHAETKAKLEALERKVEHWHIDLETEDIYILPRIEKEMAETVQAIQNSRTRRHK